MPNTEETLKQIEKTKYIVSYSFLDRLP